ncbi:MAG: mechanosensitive ion channel family protein [Candidatus Riflebacteria bacterium]|nr:mechanosensitive ion channel family protein [Candidatus Riflebacteria bacterium]
MNRSFAKKSCQARFSMRFCRVLGFARLDTLGNVLSLLAIRIDGPVQVGAWVKIDGLSGRMTETTWRHTVIETLKSSPFAGPAPQSHRGSPSDQDLAHLGFPMGVGARNPRARENERWRHGSRGRESAWRGKPDPPAPGTGLGGGSPVKGPDWSAFGHCTRVSNSTLMLAWAALE